MNTTPPVPPPRRHYAPPATHPTGPRSTDTMRIVTHAGPLVLGFGVGSVWVVWLGWPLYTPLLTAAAVWTITQAAMRIAGAVAGQYFATSGTSTPHRREFSHAQALAAQGRYEEAAAAYQAHVAEAPADPEPYLSIARILRDHLHRHADAARWFRMARRDTRLTPGQDLLIAQELIELYRHRLNEPRRAIPELARIPQIARGTPQAEAATKELAELRAQLRDQAGNGADGRNTGG